MNFSKILNWIFGIMAFIGVFLIIGAVGASDYAVEMGIYKRDKKIRQLENERNQLMAENQELKYIINDIQSVNDIMREDIEKECAAECGCIVIEGSRTSAAYQDLVGILLANNYSVEVIPMDERRKLKIIIKESEV